MIYEITDTDKVSAIFDGWDETLIWSCLQGIMGKIYADDAGSPQSAAAVLGDFIFLAGKPNAEFADGVLKQSGEDFMLIVPQNEAWTDAVTEFYGSDATVVSRYAIKKEPGIFDRDKLEEAVMSLPCGYELRMIDERLYNMCRAEEWSKDLVAQFPDYDGYRRLGLGAVILKDNAVVSGASSYSRYLGGIEIEIDTKKEYRRKGLAYICGAKLILECLKRDLYPSWDAQNKASVALAEKLGYHYSHSYKAIEIQRH